MKTKIAPSKTIGVHLKSPLASKIEAIAAKDRRSVSSVVAMIIEDRLSGDRELTSPPAIDGPKGGNFASIQPKEGN
ncbi:hypothetical protein [Cerasicoccus frondis]|uniref:hypothetical protein n=1 Tax=Cerasicoccus frondis TaxID=490090 RepID=UPI002852C804|nr:hypothetical protein [Cerasicoccus frondis]